MSNANVGTTRDHTNEIRRLSTLLEVSQALSGTLNLKSALHRVLEILGKHHGAIRSVVTLLGEDGELTVEAADGLEELPHNIRYRVGEGITGRVVESGRPIVVPEVSREPLFLNRTGVLGAHGKGELTYVCVPVTISGRTVGTLGVALPHRKDRRPRVCVLTTGWAGWRWYMTT